MKLLFFCQCFDMTSGWKMKESINGYLCSKLVKATILELLLIYVSKPVYYFDEDISYVKDIFM